jgi:hypothetical protein
MSFMIMANRAYRFPNPSASLSYSEKSHVSTTQDFKEAYAEVHPGSALGTFGNPISVPDWVRHDGMFKLAVKDKNIVVLFDEPVVVLDPTRPTPVEQKKLEAAGVASAAVAVAEATNPEPPKKPADPIEPEPASEPLAAKSADGPAEAPETSGQDAAAPSKKKKAS